MVNEHQFNANIDFFGNYRVKQVLFFGWRSTPDPAVETGAVHDASPGPGTSLPDSPPLDALSK